MNEENEIEPTLIEGLAALNQRLNDLEIEADGTKKEINDFQGEYAKEVKLLQQQIDDITVQIDRLIREAVKDIPIAKDGKDGKDYNEDVAKALLKAEINKLVKQRNLETENIKSEVLQAVENIPVQKGDKGEDGKNVTDEQIQTYITDWLDDNIESLKGARGIQGHNGKDGEDGISIIDAKIENDKLIILFSNGDEKSIAMPKPKTIYAGGGGGDSALKQRVEIENMFITAQANLYTELSYIDGDISNINVYNNDTKTALLFTKDITYINGNISNIKILDKVNIRTLTKDISYDDYGNIDKISSNYKAGI